MDPRQSVRPGEPIRLAAEQVNGLNRLLNNRGGFGAPGDVTQPLPYTWVMCRSAIQVDRWKPLAITGLEIQPTTVAKRSSFEDMPLVTGAAPVAGTTAWGIAVEPIAQNGIGRVAVAGVVPVRTVDLGKIGGYQLLYKDLGVWALIQIGGGLRLGTISTTWTKNTTATVTDIYGDLSAKTGPSTFTAVNYFATVNVPLNSTRRVACGKVDDRWLLIAAEC